MIHLIKTGISRAAGQGQCVAGISRPQHTRWIGRKMRIVDVKVPAVPILGPQVAAVQQGGNSFDMPAINSMSELVHFFDGLTVNSVRIAYAFYSNNEFELCTTAAITIAPYLAGFLKYPTSVAANVCLSSYVDPAMWPGLYQGYSIQMTGSGTDGITTDLTHRLSHETVAILDRTADCSLTPWLDFKNVPRAFCVSAYYRNLDGTVPEVPIALPDDSTFEVVIQVTA